MELISTEPILVGDMVVWSTGNELKMRHCREGEVPDGVVIGFLDYQEEPSKCGDCGDYAECDVCSSPAPPPPSSLIDVFLFQ